MLGSGRICWFLKDLFILLEPTARVASAVFVGLGKATLGGEYVVTTDVVGSEIDGVIVELALVVAVICLASRFRRLKR